MSQISEKSSEKYTRTEDYREKKRRTCLLVAPIGTEYQVLTLRDYLSHFGSQNQRLRGELSSNTSPPTAQISAMARWPLWLQWRACTSSPCPGEMAALLRWSPGLVLVFV